MYTHPAKVAAIVNEAYHVRLKLAYCDEEEHCVKYVNDSMHT